MQCMRKVSVSSVMYTKMQNGQPLFLFWLMSSSCMAGWEVVVTFLFLLPACLWAGKGLRTKVVTTVNPLTLTVEKFDDFSIS